MTSHCAGTLRVRPPRATTCSARSVGSIKPVLRPELDRHSANEPSGIVGRSCQSAYAESTWQLRGDCVSGDCVSCSFRSRVHSQVVIRSRQESDSDGQRRSRRGQRWTTKRRVGETFGHRRVWALLRFRQGQRITPKTVYRILKLQQWFVHQRPATPRPRCRGARAGRPTAMSAGQCHPCLLRRRRLGASGGRHRLPEQHGMIERFFRNLKEACVWQHLSSTCTCRGSRRSPAVVSQFRSLPRRSRQSPTRCHRPPAGSLPIPTAWCPRGRCPIQ